MSDPERATPCECQGAGYCRRHRCNKIDHWWHLCQTRMDYFQLWEEGRGPCIRISQDHAALPRCIFRGTDPVGQLPCQLCGGRQLMINVYPCEKFWLCTEQRIGHGETYWQSIKVSFCLFCSFFFFCFFFFCFYKKAQRMATIEFF